MSTWVEPRLDDFWIFVDVGQLTEYSDLDPIMSPSPRPRPSPSDVLQFMEFCWKYWCPTPPNTGLNLILNSHALLIFFSDFFNNFNTLISKIKKIKIFILIYFQTKNIFKNQLFAACGKTSAIIWSQSFHEAESISNQCLQGIWWL